MPSNLVLGLQDMQDYREWKLSRVGYNVVTDLVNAFRTGYGTMVDQWLDTVVQRNPAWNTSPINRYRVPFARDMQDIDEDGKATPVKGRPYYDMGIPLFRGEIADGWTWERALTRTVDDLNDFLMDLMQADRRWMLRHAMSALFYNVAWTFNSSEEDQDIPATIPIFPLANNDTRRYVLRDGGTLTTQQNYTAQAADVADGTADPFPALYDKLNDMAGASGRYVAFVNGSNLVGDITALTDYTPVNRSRFVNLNVNENTLSDAVLNELYFGDEVLGEHLSGVTIVRWHALPANYIVAMDMGIKPLGMREKPEAELRGLLTQDTSGHYGNEWLSRWRRIAGMAVVNPVAAAIHRVGDASYAVPSGMTPKF